MGTQKKCEVEGLGGGGGTEMLSLILKIYDLQSYSLSA